MQNTDSNNVPEHQVLTAIINSIKCPFVVTDANGIIIMASNYFFSLFSLGINFIRGESLSEFLVETDRQRLVESIRNQLIEDGSSMQIELTGCRRDGSMISLTASVSKLKSDNPFYIISFEDKTEQQKKDDKMEKLEHQAAVGTFASGIAHEFNNVLTGIRGYAQLAKSDIGDTRLIQKAFSIIEQETLRGADLCSNLSLYSGTSKLNLGPANLPEIINHCIDLYNTQPGSGNIDIFPELENIPLVMIDQNRIKQVLINLMINARHSILPKGSGQIFIKLFSENDFIVIRVEDSGVGIQPLNLARIFDPFYSHKTPVKHHDGTTETIRGSGLGLPVSQIIIKQHKGTIEVSSKPGEGSVFTIRFPKVLAKIDSDNGGIKERTLKALVVDDEMSVREVMYRTLTNSNVETVLARNVEELVSAISSSKFDIIFLDYVLPEMNADRVLSSIREKNPDAKIVMVSGWNGSPAKRSAIEKTIDAWIEKPFNVDAILSWIRKIR